MDSQQHIKIRIGLACVAFLIATVVLVMLFGGGKMPRLFSSDYEIYVILPQAPMLSENSPVYKNGVEIGRVTKINLVDDDRNVEITTRINGNIKLYTNEECQLSLNLLGQSSLNFTPKSDVPLGEPLTKGTRIIGITPIDLLKMANTMQGDVSKALQNISAAAEEMTTSFNKINQMIGSPEEVAIKQQRLERMVDRADLMMTSVNNVLGSVDELISDPEVKEGIKVSSTQLPGVIEEGKKLMANVNQMTAQIAGLLERVDTTITKVDGNLDNITTFTEALGSDGSQFIQSLSSVAEEFEIAASQLADFARALNNPDSPIGQMINDPEFFQEIRETVKNTNRTIKNVERITVQLQPILKDFNVMSDKLARQPSLLGLGGLLDKSPPTKGIPDAYAGPWGTRNNGIPQQQSERIMMQRTPRSRLFPFGRQQYYNEPVPQQSRYASQVIDHPDEMTYDAAPIYETYPVEEFYESPQVHPNTYPVGVQTQPSQPNRVRIIPLPAVATANTAPELVGPQPAFALASVPQNNGNVFDLEIDFTPEPSSEPQTAAPQPLQWATGNAPQAEPGSKIIPASAMIQAEPKRSTEIAVPSYMPTL